MAKTNEKQIKNLQKEETKKNVSNHRTANNGANADRLEKANKENLRDLVAQLERKTAVARAKNYLQTFATSEVFKDLQDDAKALLQYIESEKKSKTGVSCCCCKWSELSDKTTEGVRSREIETDIYGNSLIENEPDTSAQVIGNLQSWLKHDREAERKAKAKLLSEFKNLDFAQLLELAKASGAIK